MFFSAPEMTRSRDDHSDVWKQLYANYTFGEDAQSMNAAVGEEALLAGDCCTECLWINFRKGLSRKRIMTNGTYTSLCLFRSQNFAVSPGNIIDAFYSRKEHDQQASFSVL
ncbi:hypothetical protein R1flu_021952 [Riccia fluitans]|uniref:Uncharacterized protein n=1 Tax=Riccia fluitans TaxID=41844 RepID=A0ABD1ZTY3_9MARC